MSGEKTEANVASLATTTTTPSSFAMGVELSARILSTTSSKLLSITSPLPLTPSLSTAEALTSSASNASSPKHKYSPITTEANNSGPVTASLPHPTPFRDLNLRTATLLTRLKNPSHLSTEELQSAIVEADTTLSTWNTELLDIEDTKRRERGLKPAAHIEVRPRSLITVREEKDSVSEDWNEQRRLRAGIEDMELRAAGRLELFLAAGARPSRAPSRLSGPVPAVSLEGARLPLSPTIGMRYQADVSM